MNNMILILFLFFLVGCGDHPMDFTENAHQRPVWYTDSQSVKNAGQTSQNSQVIPEQIIQKQIVHQQIVHQQIIQQDKPCDEAEVSSAPVKESPKKSPSAAPKTVRRKAANTGARKSQPASVPAPVPVPVPVAAPTPEVVVSPPKKLDVIIVVDTSYSMSAFLRNVGESFKDFLPALSKGKVLDWKVFFTNADHGNNGLFLFNGRGMNGEAMKLEYNGQIVQNIRYLSKSVRDHEVIFLDTLGKGPREFTYLPLNRRTISGIQRTASKCHLPPYCQSWNEQPLKALNSALVKNEEYFREDADIVAIIISDSDEGAGLHSTKRTTAEMVRTTFATHHPNKKLIAYGILMIDRDCQEQYGKGFSNEDKFAYEISDLVRLTDGTNYSLCEDDYAPLARQIVFDFQN